MSTDDRWRKVNCFCVVSWLIDVLFNRLKYTQECLIYSATTHKNSLEGQLDQGISNNMIKVRS